MIKMQRKKQPKNMLLISDDSDEEEKQSYSTLPTSALTESLKSIDQQSSEKAELYPTFQTNLDFID